MNRARIAALCLLAALFTLGTSGPARAGDPEADKARAKSYFDAALQAYAAAQYIAAADAFLKAYELLPSHSLIFSAAQAYRRQYYIDQSPDHLREALRLYRDYLSRAEQGRRRQEASDALSELAGFESRLGAEAPKKQRERPTQLLVTSRTPGAQTSIDGGPPRTVPLVARVAPGEHRVVVRAPGYYDDTQKALAVQRETISVNVLLRPIPVTLRVRGQEDAKVYADGILLASLPSEDPLRLSGGDHRISVVMPGHVPYATALSLASGSSVDLDVALPRTAQRYAALGILGLSGAGIVVTSALAIIAGGAHGRAQAIDERRKAGEISAADRDAFNALLARRDSMTTGAGVAGGAAAALGVLGLGLYLFDNADVAASFGGAPSPSGPVRPTLDPELILDARGLSIRASF